MLEPGTTLGGRYELIRKLGAGGMGVVWEGKHLRLQQRVAIKILQPDFAAVKEFQIRFEREARAAALLKSPYSVRVSDVDSSDGHTYFVMELLVGRDLGEEAEKHAPVSPPDVVDWIIQACNALQEAHDHKIIHRDIKPANIFLAEEGDKRVAKLLDFGISRYEDSVTAALTKPIDGALGTPSYMSPEQIRGRKLDSRTDIWSLGVVLYRILGGRWPFTGSTERQYLASVISDPPMPFEHLRPDLPYELANVIMKTLLKQPDERPTSARALAQMLLPFGKGGASVDPSSPAIGRVSTKGPTTEVPETERDSNPHRGGTARIEAAETVADTARDEGWGAARTVVEGPPKVTPPPALGVDAKGRRGNRRGRWVGIAVAGVVVASIGGGWFIAKSVRSARISPPPSSSSEPGASMSAVPSAAPVPTTEVKPAVTGVEPTLSAAAAGASASAAKKKPPIKPGASVSAPAPSASVPSLPPLL